MDIKILDSWLRDHLKTTASPQKIAECLSLCGPSVERIHKLGKNTIYDIEITTNRVDSASHYGIAREAFAVLPRFGIKASLKPITILNKATPCTRVSWLDTKVDHQLCPRFSAILIRDVKIGNSPKWLKNRLEAVGLRAINNIVDISNYLMLDLGQPVHTFDYDKILGNKMILRGAKTGEEIITLDGQKFTSDVDDIVIEDGEGRIIDLCGIMGGKLSAVDENTKNVLLFVQTYNPVNIRKTSMRLAHRTDAAQLFEKGLSPEQIEITIRRGIDTFIELCEGKPENEILDLYPNPYSGLSISTSLNFISKRLGIQLIKNDVTPILESLDLGVEWNNDDLIVSVPPWRAQDIEIPEDIVEEVARIYGYHNLPSQLMPGLIPDPLPNAPFEFESKVKNILKGFGAIETYTYSMVAKDKADTKGESSWVLKLRNPLGEDGEYMRLSLAPSLVSAVKQNSGIKEKIHLFEVANVYLPTRGDLPEERMTLGCVSVNSTWEETKGIIEGLLEELNMEYEVEILDGRGFTKNQRLQFRVGKEVIGAYGKLEEGGFLFFEFDMELLQKLHKPFKLYKPVPKYPAQIEDLTLSCPSKTYLGEVVKLIEECDKQIVSVEYRETFKNSKTFRVTYQNPDKTLIDREVEKIRKKVLEKLYKKFGIRLKS